MKAFNFQIPLFDELYSSSYDIKFLGMKDLSMSIAKGEFLNYVNNFDAFHNINFQLISSNYRNLYNYSIAE